MFKDILSVERLLEIFCKDINKQHLTKDLYVELLDGNKVPVQCIEWGTDKATFLCDFRGLLTTQERAIRTYDPFDVFIELVKANGLEFNGILANYGRAVGTAYQIDRLPFYAQVDNTPDCDSKMEMIAALANDLVMWVMRDNSNWDQKPDWISIDEHH
jgi:hypothetical protein